ncbi:MAG: HU family DNA-binding protein [Ignavibacteria bacterium]|nr:HU family DNA-binding protein [Ignavibacteria bacterium]
MGKSMTKSQVAAHLASKFDLKKKVATGILEEMAELSYREAKNSFTLPGIGKLVLVERKARMGRNPATGEQIHIPAKTVVKFRVAKAAKEAILAPPKPF